MKCNRCGIEIEETEVFCKDCKKVFKKISSKSKVEELEELIENQKELTELENTKELINLDSLVEEEIKQEEAVENKTKSIDIVEELIINKDSDKEDIIDEFKEKKSKKGLIIIISIISLIIVIVTLLLVFSNKKNNNNEIILDYKKIINEYGDSIVEVINEYKKDNEDIPTWKYVKENLKYDKYKVICATHDIYSNGSIYLASCKVDNKKTHYTYGKEIEEIKEGKKINVYKESYDGYTGYLSESNNHTTLLGTVTCETEICEFVSAFDKYVIIKENNQDYLYNYTDDSLVFGPFKLDRILVNNNILYGIIYKENNVSNIYSILSNKVLSNIKGTLLEEGVNFNPSIMYKYNYVIMQNNNRNDFINLKTGNVSYSINETIGEFIEDSSKKIVYIKAYTKTPDKFKIYNSNGKSLFNGEEYSNFILGKNILISNSTNFKVYDLDLKLKTSSNTYDEIIDFNEDFVLATKDSNLMILDLKDNVLASFEDSWNKYNYIYHKDLTIKDNKGIYIIMENKKIPSGTKGRYIEYYYIYSTKESGVIEKISI